METLLSRADEGPGTKHAMAFDEQGNGFAVFMQRDVDAAVYDIAVRRYVAATNQWGPLEVIDQAATTAVGPSLAVHANGDAAVAWEQFVAGTSDDVVFRRYDAASGAWDPQVEVAGGAGSAVADVSLALLGNGDALAVWRELAGDDSFWAARRDAETGAWLPAELLSQTEYVGSSTGVAAYGATEAVAFWEQPKDGAYRMHGRRFDLQNGWDAEPTVMDSAAPYGQFIREWDVTPDGSLLINNYGTSSLARRSTPAAWLDSSDAWAPVQFFEPDPQTWGNGAGWDGQGTGLVAYHYTPPTSTRTEIRVRAVDGATGLLIGEPLPLSVEDRDTLEGSVAGLPGGGWLVAWSHYGEGEDPHVYATVCVTASGR